MNARLFLFLCALSAILSACSSNDEKVLKAVQQYKLRGESIEKILDQRVHSLRKQGVDADYVWIAPDFEKDNFQVKAVIRVASRNLEEPYVWSLTAQPTATNAKTQIWSVKAESTAAKAVVRGDQWAGFGIVPR